MSDVYVTLLYILLGVGLLLIIQTRVYQSLSRG